VLGLRPYPNWGLGLTLNYSSFAPGVMPNTTQRKSAQNSRAQCLGLGLNLNYSSFAPSGKVHRTLELNVSNKEYTS